MKIKKKKTSIVDKVAVVATEFKRRNIQEESFLNNLKMIYNQAQNDYIEDGLKDTARYVYCDFETLKSPLYECNGTLTIDFGTQYYVKYSEGNITHIWGADDIFSYNLKLSDGKGIKITDIKKSDIKEKPDYVGLEV